MYSVFRPCQAALIASAQTAAGDLDDAKATAAAIEGEEPRADACRTVATAGARRGDLPALVRWIESLPGPMARAYAYVGAAEVLIAPVRTGTSAPAVGRPDGVGVDPKRHAGMDGCAEMKSPLPEGGTAIRCEGDGTRTRNHRIDSPVL